ncbi:HGxxPAAW family protein [Pseudofrankia asymbiotica]|uniref:Uncharacterized protein n=1 Tax=Pseudofrankia asymbiotica TaxID=1834516 RepID=A0A1V2IG21_9ACTN|nr:HGxxPAAW family protein [Pseudofrankia asymbiotica]ONH31401.1 hypothetical protein BL253_09095 [Pseudofrankia asymbiotica]
MSETHSAHHTKPLSWAMVLVITIGTAVGTLGVCMASWTVSIIGGAIVVLGGIIALVTGIMDDVDEHPSRDLWPIGARDASYRRQISA